mmetsp:Transcript_20018/g.29673  ORF Transcript_20018/g.29673 Transcript_20018/m.29673 type:complete len:607 (-) Transcript_20018:60-1880(-)|eukprot:CAMPEP_0194214590 /NCGR_PEP_ID=MMETSP0156-20130528/15865_1 /TAXON_ID=33649 /ORGANISM="Thalassionema nitzschioides, Strain L26-B" /LENGTH=606 /DNA_ID=CAMNT_0038942881 /DNA_START=156 /DNA_END=1976 /DNA_ORIENTATION=+
MSLTSPALTATLMASEEPLLTVIAENMRIRSEVEETMRSLLTDVELTNSLETTLQWEAERAHLAKKAIVHEIAWQEMKMIQEEDACKASQLADALVKDLHKVSQELGQLRRWKKTATDERELERKQWEEQLKQAEVQILTLFKEQQHQKELKSMAVSDIVENQQLPSASKDDSSMPSSEIPRDVSPAETAKPKEDSADEKDLETGTMDDANLNSETKQLQHEDQDVTSSPKPDIPSTGSITSANAVAATLELDDDQPRLETFEESLLLNIFAYMDALEIVQLAQVNIALYSRVDSLFGISEQSAPAGAPPPKEIQTISSPPQGTIVALPPEGPAVAQKSSKPAPVDAKKASSNNSGGIISLFQTSRPKEAPKSQATTLAAPTSASSYKSPLSAAMANSMAEKLTDTEINAIISMTEKLNRRNKEVETFSKENASLKGELQGTEAIKSFLVQKVRELEISLSKNQEVEIKTAQQIASDQEVIAFLDSRVQELERRERTLEIEAKTAREDLVRNKVQSDSKITVLSDMLRYERERLAENDSDWKGTKKVLVKEVKLCRAQIMALQAERNGLMEQVEQLQKAVLPIGGSRGMPGSIVLNSPLSSPSGPP